MQLDASFVLFDHNGFASAGPALRPRVIDAGDRFLVTWASGTDGRMYAMLRCL